MRRDEWWKRWRKPTYEYRTCCIHAIRTEGRTRVLFCWRQVIYTTIYTTLTKRFHHGVQTSIVFFISFLAHQYALCIHHVHPPWMFSECFTTRLSDSAFSVYASRVFAVKTGAVFCMSCVSRSCREHFGISALTILILPRSLPELFSPCFRLNGGSGKGFLPNAFGFSAPSFVISHHESVLLGLPTEGRLMQRLRIQWWLGFFKGFYIRKKLGWLWMIMMGSSGWWTRLVNHLTNHPTN
jgi:hypothetical protein